MSNIPENCKYTKTHEWARVESDGTITIGIDDFAQKSLGDMVFVELPAVGATVIAGKQVLELSVWLKSASDLYSPLSARVAGYFCVCSEINC